MYRRLSNGLLGVEHVQESSMGRYGSFLGIEDLFKNFMDRRSIKGFLWGDDILRVFCGRTWKKIF